MIKKLFLLLMSSILIISLTTGCANNESNEIGDNNNASKQYEVLDYINLIKPENTVEEINKIIGFEGTLIDEQYNRYYWEFPNDTGIQVTYFSSSTGTIVVEIDDEVLANKKVDFSKTTQLKEKVKEGITYDEFKTYVGNVDGIVVEKSDILTYYLWVDKDGNTLKASFGNNDGKCSAFFGSL